MVRRSSPATSWHASPAAADTLPPLAMWPTFLPGLGLLRRLRPHPGSSVDDAVARHRHGRPVGRASPGGFPRSLRFDRRDGCPTVPLRHSHEYAVDLPHGLPASRYKPAQESPELGAAGACAAYQPTSTRLELAVSLRVASLPRCK